MNRLITSISILIVLFLVSLNVGSVSVGILDLMGDSSFLARQLILENRLPRSILALLVGGGCGVSGVLLQTLFKNPLAGPTTLGVTSGASLGIVVFLFLPISMVIDNYVGSAIFALVFSLLFVFGIILAFRKFRNISLVLVLGLLLSYFSYSIIEVLIQYSEDDAIKTYVFWGMGSLNQFNWLGIISLAIISGFGILSSFRSISDLNLYLLGEDEMKLNGIEPKNIKWKIIIISCVWIAVITCLVGPIAFIGVVIPNLIKLIFKTHNHKVLLPFSLIGGAALCLIADILSRGVLFEIVLPLNSVLSIFGAPLIIYLLYKKRNESYS